MVTDAKDEVATRVAPWDVPKITRADTGRASPRFAAVRTHRATDADPCACWSSSCSRFEAGCYGDCSTWISQGVVASGKSTGSLQPIQRAARS